VTCETTVRKARPEDLEEIVALWAHYLRNNRGNPAYRNLPPDAVALRREVFVRHVTGKDSAVFVVERRDGGLDGMLTCFVEQNCPYLSPPRYGRLQTPYVRPDARKRGNLHRLLSAAYRWLGEKGLTEVRMFNSADNVLANAIAEELGFRAIEVVRRRRIDPSLPMQWLEG